MQIKKKITVTYIALSGISTLALCIVVFFLFKQNNQYYFLKRLQDRAKIASSIYSQKDPVKAEYYQKLRSHGLEELVDEKDYVLKINGENTFEYNTELHLQPEFYSEVMKKGASWVMQDDHRYFYAQMFNESGSKYMVIVTAKDRRGNTSLIYISRILIIGGLAFIIIAYFFGRFLAIRVINPVSRITREVKRISASNLHNRLLEPEKGTDDEIADLTKTFNNMLDRLETSFEIQANFINNASHELKTPITTIIAETEITLLKEREASEYIASIENINKQATRLATLTESLLKLTLTGYDGQKQVQDITRVDDLLMEVKCNLDKLYPENRVNINLNVPEDDSLLVLPCNRPLLELAVGNIITNGVKYSDNDEVFVNLSADNNTIKIIITDIGIGIPPEDVPYLYEPFFRGKKAASKYVGYGLGLPLAMKIIRIHNGDLIIQSEPDKGTVVTIIFNRPNIKTSNVKS